MNVNNLRVFIVDDELSVVRWLRKNVDWSVYNCKVVGDSTGAVEALQYMEEYTVDLLITDICMPELSGLELIRKVKERYPDMFIIVISAFDKFEYVKDAFQYGIIDYCLKPIDVDELCACLKSVQVAYKERHMRYKSGDNIFFQNSILQRLLRGYDSTYRLEEQCELAGISLEVPICQLVLMDTCRLEKAAYLSVMEQLDNERWDGLHFLLDEEMNLVLLFLGENGYDRENETKLKKLLLREGVLHDIRISVGKPLRSSRQIAESYQVCRDFVNASFLFPDYSVRTERYPYEKYLVILKNKKLQQFGNSLKTGSPELVERSIRKILEGCHTEEKKKAELICLTIFMVKNMRSSYSCKNVGSIPKGYLESLISSDKMLAWIVKFYMGMTTMPQEDDNDMHPLVKWALKEVSSYYMNKTLSIQGIAEACHVSPPYMGQLFKEETGFFFNDYLLKMRLQIAESLLYEGALRIGEIADVVGFSSQSYFNKMFRRSYGISPAEYRRLRREEK